MNAILYTRSPSRLSNSCKTNHSIVISAVQCFDTGGCWVHPDLKVGCCWFVGGDDLTGAWHVLQFQLSSPPPSSLAPPKTRIETFWYRVMQIHLENDHYNEDRERITYYDKCGDNVHEA